MDQGGYFPADLLAPMTVHQLQRAGIGHELAGLSGNVTETLRRVRAGEPLDGQVSSWIYWPGLRADEAPGLAILWDRKGGLDADGRRAGGRAVGFADGTYRLIPESQWPAFVREQNQLRSEVRRHRHPKAGPLAQPAWRIP